MKAGTETTNGSLDLARRVGITYRQLDMWCRQGILQPLVHARGSGTQRQFDETEVRVASAVAQLAVLGLSSLPLFVCSYEVRRLLNGHPAPCQLLVSIDGSRTSNKQLAASVVVNLFGLDGVSSLPLTPTYVVTVEGELG